MQGSDITSGNIKDKEFERVQTFCFKCSKEIEGELILKGDKIYLKKKCPIHGIELKEYYPNSADYFKIQRAVNRAPLSYKPVHKDGMIINPNPEDIVTSIHINLTDRCNLACPNCFANSVCSNSDDISSDLTLDVILNQLERFNNKKHKPMIVLVGGEPTLREDLGVIISSISKLGYSVRLSTNGIKLKDLNYLTRLKEAGLEWLLLQFDGFKPATSMKFRNQDLIEIKRRVLENANALKLKTNLVTMISKNANIDEISKIIHFAFDTGGIYSVSFYPLSKSGRFKEDHTTLDDFFREIELQTNGTVTKNDFLQFMNWLSILSKILKKPILRQKLCRFAIFLYRRGGKLYTINRLFKISSIIRHPIFTFRYLLKLFQLFGWLHRPTKDFLYLNLENFYDAESLVLNHAYNCHNLFLTEKGYIPFCIYNNLYREK